MLMVLIALTLATAVIVIIVETNREQKPKEEPIVFGDTYVPGTLPNLGNGHLVIDRDYWGSSELARKPTVRLKHPVPYVLITHVGAESKPCSNIYMCSKKMRTIQDLTISEKFLPDLYSNFYVGDDGNIYVGRGWNWANSYASNSLAVTFMGNYDIYSPSEKQLDAAKYLLAHALTNKFITLDYKLVAQNHTSPTKRSPGKNVYSVIKNWPHFYPCNMNGIPHCGAELGMPQFWNATQ